jgi:hypothetical protein
MSIPALVKRQSVRGVHLYHEALLLKGSGSSAPVTPRTSTVFQSLFKGNSPLPISLPPFTREVRVRIATGTVDTPNGITAGEYTSPYPPDGYIFPELLVLGDPMFPHEFNLLPFLAQGSGPWLGGIPGQPQAASGPIVQQLNPWPGVTKPAQVACNPNAPIAHAGADFTALTGSLVTLVGSTNLASEFQMYYLDLSLSKLRSFRTQLPMDTALRPECHLEHPNSYQRHLHGAHCFCCHRVDLQLYGVEQRRFF